MAGTLKKITAFHQQILSSNKYAFINSVHLQQDQKQNKNHKLKFISQSMCNPLFFVTWLLFFFLLFVIFNPLLNKKHKTGEHKSCKKLYHLTFHITNFFFFWNFFFLFFFFAQRDFKSSIYHTKYQLGQYSFHRENEIQYERKQINHVSAHT